MCLLLPARQPIDICMLYKKGLLGLCEDPLAWRRCHTEHACWQIMGVYLKTYKCWDIPLLQYRKLIGNEQSQWVCTPLAWGFLALEYLQERISGKVTAEVNKATAVPQLLQPSGRSAAAGSSPMCSWGSISASAVAISESSWVFSMIFSRKSMFCCILSSGTLKSSMERFALACLAILKIRRPVLKLCKKGFKERLRISAIGPSHPVAERSWSRAYSKKLCPSSPLYFYKH